MVARLYKTGYVLHLSATSLANEPRITAIFEIHIEAAYLKITKTWIFAAYIIQF